MTELDPETERQRLQHIEDEIAKGRRDVAENDSNLPHGETYAEPEETEGDDAARARERANERDEEDHEGDGDVDRAIAPPG